MEKKPEFKPDFDADLKYREGAMRLGGWNGKDLVLSRYLKTLDHISSTHPDKNICLLFRTNKLYGANIQKISDQLQTWSQKGRRIYSNTTHGFKGEEERIVVVVDAMRRSYPKIHPDYELLEILNVTLSDVLDEERRLLYVAVTRAKETLYILYEEEVGISDLLPRESFPYKSFSIRQQDQWDW